MRINQKQKYAMIGGLLLIVVMVLFPPWAKYISRDSDYLPAGYGFIADPPTADIGVFVKIDVTRLSFQILTVFALTGIGVLTFSRETEPDS